LAGADLDAEAGEVISPGRDEVWPTFGDHESIPPAEVGFGVSHQVEPLVKQILQPGPELIAG
jgi:hypothetical protein